MPNACPSSAPCATVRFGRRRRFGGTASRSYTRTAGSGDSDRSRAPTNGTRDGPLLFPPLELPGREAADVDVELVQPGIVPIAGELNLELHLGALDGEIADGTHRPDARPS